MIPTLYKREEDFILLRVWFGNHDDSIVNASGYFDNTFRSEWLEDPYVVGMIHDIDGSTVESPRCIRSPVLGQIAPWFLSGGVKACILMLKDDDAMIDLRCCGQNCEEWLVQIACMKDITVACTTYDLKFKDLPVRGICLNDGSPISDWRSWCESMLRCLHG